MARIKPQIKINPNLLTTKYVKSASDNKFTSHLYGDTSDTYIVLITIVP